MGPLTITCLDKLLHDIAARTDAVLVAATNADAAGDGYAGQLAEMARAAGVRHERLLPDGGHNDWNDLLKARRPR